MTLLLVCETYPHAVEPSHDFFLCVHTVSSYLHHYLKTQTHFWFHYLFPTIIWIGFHHAASSPSFIASLINYKALLIIVLIDFWSLSLCSALL